MDSPCFTAPLTNHLPNQGNMLSTSFRNFGDYPRIIPYDMHLHEAAYNSDVDKEEKDIFQTLHANTNMRYQPTAIRKSGSSVTDFHNGSCNGENNNNDLPADLSVRSPPIESQQQQHQQHASQTNTRLLREILQGRKPEDAPSCKENECTTDDAMEEDNGDDAGSNSPSFFDDSDAEIGGEDYQDNEGAATAERAVNHIDDLGSAGEDAVHVKRARVENIVKNISTPYDGNCASGASSENSGPSSVGRKDKRKQVLPKQLDGNGAPYPEREIWRKQFKMMQDQMEVMQERFVSIFEADASTGLPGTTQNGHQGLKRKHSDGKEQTAQLSQPTGPRLVLGNCTDEVGKLAALISTEINDHISPIITSALNKYFHTNDTAPVENHPIVTKPRTRTPSLAREPVPRSPSLSVHSSPMRNTPKTADRSKQPLSANNDTVHTGKHNIGYMHNMFPTGRPFFNTENKFGADFFNNMTNLAAMAAPTMYSPNFPHFFRPGFFPEQTEAIPLVVAPKKKRHKVTDSRVTPRVMSKMLNQKEESSDGHKFLRPSPGPLNGILSCHPFLGRSREGLQNSLNHSPDFSAFHPSSMQEQGRHILAGHGFYSQHPNLDRHDASPMNGSAGSPVDHSNDHNSLDPSDTESTDNMSSGGHPGQTISFASRANSMTLSSHSSTQLTPLHLRKAKLMFFYTRYPNSATLKTYFPDIKFNKNNTAQLVKWFSNFREFYYIQMEKSARQLLIEGVRNADDIHVSKDSELYRALNTHYNRNNHIEVRGIDEVPDTFREVVEETLKEFFKSVQTNRDQEPSWKKAIYKVINRMDDIVPEYFKSPLFLQDIGGGE